MCAAGLALASCSQDEVLSVNDGKSKDNLVTFRVHTPKISRSQELTTENLTEFMVYGFVGMPEEVDGTEPMESFFDGEAVKFANAGDGIFTSETPYYYPLNGSDLYFAAYAPADLNVEVADNYGGLKIADFTVDEDITKQKDVIFANGAGHLDVNEGDMDLTFYHALTKVFVSEVANSGNPYRIEIKGVKFGNIHNTGESIYRGDLAINNESEVINGNGFQENGYIQDYIGNGIFWKPTGEQTGEMVTIFDEPIVLDSENTRMNLMSGYDAADTKGSFMLVPQQLSKESLNEDGTLAGKEFDPTMSYIAFLVRIVNVDKEFTYTDEETGEEVTEGTAYPYTEGVEAISRTFDGVTYAWAAFPLSSLWVPGMYTDYFVDFSKGAGFVAPGADASVECKPILSHEIKFTETVGAWEQGSQTTVDHENELGVDTGDFEDAFGD